MSPWVIPSDDVLCEHAYLVARGVRPLSLAGHLEIEDEVSLLSIATKIERHAQPNVVPFVVDHGDRIASFGYASTRWVVDLYEWAVRDPAVPENMNTGSWVCSSGTARPQSLDTRMRAQVADSLLRRPH